MNVGQPDGTVRDEMVLTGSNLTEATGIWTRKSARNVDFITLVNAMALTTTTPTASNPFDLSKYNDVIFLAKNSHNQIINIEAQIGSVGISIWNGTAYGIVSTGVPTDNRYTHLNSKESWMSKGLLATNVRFVLTAAVAPASGSISIYALGVYN